uniref:Uncharacterized protein n=1 Tax=Parascaris equorum TaxID=6256 RepID=A0A914RC53_PAREQ
MNCYALCAVIRLLENIMVRLHAMAVKVCCISIVAIVYSFIF